MRKGGYVDKHVKAESKQTKIRVFWVTTSCTLEQVCVRMSSACVHRLDHAYIDPYPENPNQHRNKAKTQNVQSNNLSCLEIWRKPKTNLDKHKQT